MVDGQSGGGLESEHFLGGALCPSGFPVLAPIRSNLDAHFFSPVTPRSGRLMPCFADSPQQHAQVAMIPEATARFRPR